jgi:hypothetical protein
MLKKRYEHEPVWLPHMANSVIDPNTGEELEYRQLIKRDAYRDIWTRSYANELGRLAQGVGDRIQGTNTIFFIRKDQVPKGRTCTYGRICVDVRPHKEEKERTRLTVGGNLIHYPGDVSTKTAGLTTAKLLFNSTISTPGAKFMSMDVKNFYLNTPMARFEYMRLPMNLLPDEIKQQYKLQAVADDGWVYVEIRKGMYGLPQAGLLANKLLQERLATHGYEPVTHTHGLWRHKTRPITFSLVVDDFGVKYVGKENADHLLNTLRQYYPTTADWDGELYCGITLKWNYDEHWVELSMPHYVKSALHKFQHRPPSRKHLAPSRYTPPNYGAKQQLTTLDTADDITPPQRLTLQRVVGTFLYYARAVDPTMLHALNTLASAQAKGTQTTVQSMTDFMNYCATYPNATIRYVASDMILHCHSDAAYLTEPEARSRAGGHHYLGNLPHNEHIHNGSILDISRILKMVVASAAEAEVGALYVNAQEATVLRVSLHEMGHPQPATPIRTDNSTADGIINGTVKQQRSKAIDMRFYWVRDRTQQQQFHIYWAPGTTNFGDYFTKHHPTHHHQTMRPHFLHEPTMPIDHSFLRGCVDPHSGLKSRVTDRRTNGKTNARQQARNGRHRTTHTIASTNRVRRQ